jgi:hypothetical protein
LRAQPYVPERKEEASKREMVSGPEENPRTVSAAADCLASKVPASNRSVVIDVDLIAVFGYRAERVD